MDDRRRRVARLKRRALDFLARPWRFFRALCFSIGFVVLLGGTGFSVYLYRIFAATPDVSEMSFTRLKVLAKRSVRRRMENKRRRHYWVPMSRVNRDLVFSFVMSEDANFFQHKGVNYDAILYSVAENIKKKSYAFGASTISQQVVKNVFLSNEKKIARKLKELKLTGELEKRFTKNQILEVYLNVAELGPDLFGVTAASYHYFRKPPRKINAAEGAFMALMLPSPRRNHYSIFQNKNLTKPKRKKLLRILRGMLYNEYISPKQYRRYARYRYFR